MRILAIIIILIVSVITLACLVGVLNGKENSVAVSVIGTIYLFVQLIVDIIILMSLFRIL